MTEDLTLTFEPLKAGEIGLTKACGSDGRREGSAQNNVGGIASDLNFSRRLVHVATSSWKLVCVSFTRIRYLLSFPFFHHGSARDPASRRRWHPQLRLSP